MKFLFISLRSVLLCRCRVPLDRGAFLFAHRFAYRVAAERGVVICSCRSSPRMFLLLVLY